MNRNLLTGIWHRITTEEQFNSIRNNGGFRVKIGTYQGQGRYLKLIYKQRCPRNCCDDTVIELLSTEEALQELSTEISKYISNYSNEIITNDEEITRLQKQLETAHTEIAGLHKEITQLRGESITRRTTFENKDYWIWQGDGTDHPESITCHVLMTANQLRNILNCGYCPECKKQLTTIDGLIPQHNCPPPISRAVCKGSGQKPNYFQPKT